MSALPRAIVLSEEAAMTQILKYAPKCGKSDNLNTRTPQTMSRAMREAGGLTRAHSQELS